MMVVISFAARAPLSPQTFTFIETAACGSRDLAAKE